MEINDILLKLQEVIHESTGIEPDEIQLDKTLFDDLDIDSIDMVDILFELESEYDIELKLSKLEELSKEELNGQTYENNGVITSAGLDSLRKHMDEIDPENFKEGLTIHELVKLFTVHSLCKLVKHQIENKED